MIEPSLTSRSASLLKPKTKQALGQDSVVRSRVKRAGMACATTPFSVCISHCGVMARNTRPLVQVPDKTRNQDSDEDAHQNRNQERQKHQDQFGREALIHVSSFHLRTSLAAKRSVVVLSERASLVPTETSYDGKNVSSKSFPV